MPTFAAKRLHEIFEARAREAPKRLAVCTLDEEITYGELDARANRVALQLRSLGAAPEVLVGLCVDRSIEMIVGLLAILKSGSAYVPIDPTYPRKRIDFLLADSDVKVVVTVSRVAQRLGESKARILNIDDDSLPAIDDVKPLWAGSENDLAYVIYTSGSTGVPKGVLVEHHNVIRLFEQTDRWFQFNEHDVWTMFHSISFDFSVWEVWGALLYGGCLVVVPYELSRSPRQFDDLLREKRVTILNQTPSAFRQLVAANLAHEKTADFNLRFVIFGGEALQVKLLEPWIARYGDDRPALINMYGITETTVHTTYKRILRDDLKRPEVSPIGVPIPDLQLYLLDETGELRPDGTPGEIYVAGPGLARGYLNRNELNAERFVQKPGVTRDGARLYKSGDRAVRQPDGEFAYLGRVDDQVKVRGFRIEPREIELSLGQHPKVASAVVISHDYGDGDVRLLSYVVPRPAFNSEVEIQSLPAELAEYAAAELPTHMRPSDYIVVHEIPLTAHGKVDREALRQLSKLNSGPNRASSAGLTETEQAILAICEDVLERSGLGLKDDFFDIGGTSLALLRVFAEVNAHFNVALDRDTNLIFAEPTIGRLASCVDLQLQSHSVKRLARAVLDVRPLVNALPAPARVVPANGDNASTPIAELEQLLNTVTSRAGTSQLKLHTSAADLTVMEQMVSQHLRLEDYYEVSTRLSGTSELQINEIVDQVLEDSFERRYRCSHVNAFDGAPLRAYASGKPGGKAIVIVLPCGMPAQLCDRWLEFLGKDYFTITWESRALFAEPDNFDALNCDVATQAQDLFAVMDHFEVQAAHVMGLCGGASIAIKAAAAQPERVSSLSLWHGDFNLGVNSPQTTHQRHLRALMSIGSASRAQAASLHKLFQQSMMIDVRADLAHVVLYPYAAPEVLFRYAKLNGSIMHTDISDCLARVTQPALVVTSEADHTTHPEGSIRVAKALPHATLRIEPAGDHLSLFDAEPHITALAADFIANAECIELIQN